jgi:hypothetical protein
MPVPVPLTDKKTTLFTAHPSQSARMPKHHACGLAHLLSVYFPPMDIGHIIA